MTPKENIIIAMNVAFIPQEEKNLEETFGQQFLDYKKRNHQIIKYRCLIMNCLVE